MVDITTKSVNIFCTIKVFNDKSVLVYKQIWGTFIYFLIWKRFSTIFSPKDYPNSMLDVYKSATERVGSCETSFPDCPVSLFNFVPTFDPDNEEILVSFDPIQTGSKSKTKLDDNL